DRPTSGHYLLDEADVSGLDRDQLADIRNHKIGFVFQNFNLLPRTSARENAELPLIYSAQRLSNAQLRERADRVLNSVGLADLIGQPRAITCWMRQTFQDWIAISSPTFGITKSVSCFRILISSRARRRVRMPSCR